jgi:enoyl-CoA hydratase
MAGENNDGATNPPRVRSCGVTPCVVRTATVPQNQLMMQKLMVNQALYNMGLMGTQMIATVFDGITRHSPEGLNFKRRSEQMGWKHAVDERDQGTFDWTTNQPITQNR